MDKVTYLKKEDGVGLLDATSHVIFSHFCSQRKQHHAREWMCFGVKFLFFGTRRFAECHL